MASATTWFSYTDESVGNPVSNVDKRERQSLWSDKRGSALVEAAIVVPVLIVFLSGVFEFSWYFYQQHLVAIGLHDAASYLARSSDPCNPASRAWKTEQEHAKNLATSGSINGGTPRVKGWTGAMVTPQCTKVDNPRANRLTRYRGASVYIVTVSTQVPYSSLGFFDLVRMRSPIISAAFSERAIESR